MRRFVTILLIAALFVPATAMASSCPSGSGPRAACESYRADDIFLYLWIDFMTVIVSGADLAIGLGPPPKMAVHPLNVAHYAMGGMALLLGTLGLNDVAHRGSARATFTLGVVSLATAAASTAVIAGRHHRQRRVERRLKQELERD